MPSLSGRAGSRVSMLMPGSTIGIIGGGQLGPHDGSCPPATWASASACLTQRRTARLGQVADFQITAEYDDQNRHP